MFEIRSKNYPHGEMIKWFEDRSHGLESKFRPGVLYGDCWTIEVQMEFGIGWIKGPEWIHRVTITDPELATEFAMVWL